MTLHLAPPRGLAALPRTRALQIAAMEALIAVTLDSKDSGDAQFLLNSLQASDLAELHENAGHVFLTIYGISGCSTGTSTQILRNWQEQALFRLTRGR